MGQSNAAVRQWIGKPDRFADLFNGIIFQGAQVIVPEELESVDSESDILDIDKNGNAKEIRRHRDIIMRWKQKTKLVLLACENQDKIHYAMPVRNMLYDSLSYTEQMKKLWDDKHDRIVNSEEFLSKFCKDDKLYPVITLVLYYGENQWDGALALYELFGEEFAEYPEILTKYVANYRINLVDVGHMRDVQKFKTDLQRVFGMLQYREQKDDLKRYLNENAAYFQHVDVETYQVLGAFLHSGRMLKENVKIEGEEEEVDMCKALEDIYADGKNAGILEGKLEGGIAKVREQIQKKLAKGKSVEQIAEELEETSETIQALIETM